MEVQPLKFHAGSVKKGGRQIDQNYWAIREIVKVEVERWRV